MGNIISSTKTYITNLLPAWGFNPFFKTIDPAVEQIAPKPYPRNFPRIIEDEREACNYFHEKIRHEKYKPPKQNKAINTANKKNRLPKDKEELCYLLEIVNTLYEKTENKEHGHTVLETFIIRISEDLRKIIPVYNGFINLCKQYVHNHKNDPIQLKWESIFSCIEDSLIRYIFNVEEHYFGENCHEEYNLNNDIESHKKFIKSLLPEDKFYVSFDELRKMYSVSSDYCPNQIFKKILDERKRINSETLKKKNNYYEEKDWIDRLLKDNPDYFWGDAFDSDY